MNNIVFFFSGTGNCLKAAKTIAEKLGNCEIISMGKGNPGKITLPKKYDSIGFVFPVYFFGLPKRVVEFIENLDLSNNQNAYYYSLATHGGDVGNAACQIYELIDKRHNIKMNFNCDLKMFSNYVNMYNMRKNADETTKKANENLVPIVNSIKNRETNSVNKLTKVFAFVNTSFRKNVSAKDKNYNISDNCTGCGICSKVCPVNNIELSSNKPQFKHNCEQCVACIQYCPLKAINYKNSTQKRRRYTHPEIDYRELSRYNH